MYLALHLFPYECEQASQRSSLSEAYIESVDSQRETYERIETKRNETKRPRREDVVFHFSETEIARESNRVSDIYRSRSSVEQHRIVSVVGLCFTRATTSFDDILCVRVCVSE